MKPVTVTNIMLQFDIHDDMIGEEIVKAQIDLINTMLSETFPDSQPQIMMTDDSEMKLFWIDDEEL